jgi:hypothetical protein
MLAAAGAVVIVGGIAAAMPAMVGVAGCGARLLRALGRIGAAERGASVEDDGIIEAWSWVRVRCSMYDARFRHYGPVHVSAHRIGEAAHIDNRLPPRLPPNGAAPVSFCTHGVSRHRLR